MKISSFLSFSTQDGPGVRSVIFLQGCPLRCIYCHNPEAQEVDDKVGVYVDIPTLSSRIVSFKKYYGDKGGVTFSGGEPLLQINELILLCKELKKENINICLETSGYIKEINAEVIDLIKLCDIIYCDLKFNTEEKYLKYTQIKGLKFVLEFLKQCQSLNKKVVIRSVIIPNINDKIEDIQDLLRVLDENKIKYPLKLLGFNNMCFEKYMSIKKDFKLKETSNMGLVELKKLQEIIDKYKRSS